MTAQVGSSNRQWIPGQYIVVLKQSLPDPNGVVTDLLARFGGIVVQRYGSAIKGVTLKISDSFAQQLASDPNVAYVEQDQMAYGATVQTGVQWWLDRVDQRQGSDGNFIYNADGSGVTIYILDTGLNFSHADFGGRASLGADFVNAADGGVDCHGHGTHVAGIAAGTEYGVAKKASLVAVRVLPCSLAQPVSTIVAGVDWVTANRVLPAVANMSIFVDRSDALDDAVANSIASGVTYVVAAGNLANMDGVSPDACNFSPGRVPGAITVGALAPSDVIAGFSKTGPCVDLFAPGYDILSDWIGGPTAIARFSGTSMATPHVAGAAAQYLQLRPTATPAEVSAALVNNATPNTVTFRPGLFDLPPGTPSLVLYTGFIGNATAGSSVARVALTVPMTTLAIGQSTAASATPQNASGTALTGQPVTWSSADQFVASVSPTGLITGVSSGLTTITATSGNVTSVRVKVLVTQPTIPTTGAALVSAAGYGCLTTSENLNLNTAAPCVGGALGQTWVVPPTGTQGSITLSAVAGCVTGFNSAVAGQPVGMYTCSNWSSQQWTLTSAGELKLSTGACAAAVPDVSYVLIMLQTCDGSLAQRWTVGGNAPPAPIANVFVYVPQPSLTVGQGTVATATLRDVFGTILVGRTIAWTSSDPTIATVSSTGVITAAGVGTAVVTATSEGRSHTAVITVTAAPVTAVATVGVSIGSSTLLPLATSQATATLRDAVNNVLTGRVVTWSSSNPLVATVTPTGLVAAVAPGTATITATSEGKSGSVTVTVNVAPPAAVATVAVSLPSTLEALLSAQASATLKDAGGNTLGGRTISWSSSNTSVATVSATGVVTGVAAGTATITATSEGKSGSAPITITPASVATIAVTLADSSLELPQTAQGAVVLKDAAGNVLSGRTVTWSSSNTSVATVSASGLVTAVAAGTATITATSDGKSATVGITVALAPVATVGATIANASLLPGQTSQATATTKDASGNTLTGRTVTWASSNTSVATVNSSGLVTAVAAGSATITATSEGKSGTVGVTVSQTPVATVSVTIANATPVVGQTSQATATTKDAGGNTLTGRAVTWASSNTSVATVSSSGLVTAVAAGSATITATSEGKSGTVGVTVAVPPVATVAVTIADASLTLPQTSQAAATLKDASGAVLTGRTVTWTSSNTAVATVSSSGLVTAVATGSATITATSEGKTGTVGVTVAATPVATVAVTIADPSLTFPQTSQATATTKDAGGNVLTGRTITWASSNTSVATVSSTGLVTAVAAGSATITATSEGKSGTVAVTVTVAAVSTVSVTIADASLILPQTSQATATLKDAAGNVLTGRAVTWSSSNTAVATVNSSGLVTGVAGGSATITATSGGKSGTVSVTVTVPVATVSVTIADASLTLPQTSQATATTKDAGGNTLTGRTVTWTSSNTAVATVSSTGLVTGVAAGSATITATSEGKTGTVSVAVTGATVASVTTTIADASLEVGQTSAATATPKDASGRAISGRTIAWSSSNTGVATVSSSGVVTAVGAGSATITGATGGKSGAVSVTIAPPPAPSLTVSCYRTACGFDARESTNAVTWAWTFGDGNTQTDNDGWTYHIYDDDVSRTYTVTLKVTNAGGTTRSLTKTVTCRNGSCS